MFGELLAEDAFQQGIRSTPWFKEFVAKYGEEPNLSDPNYDYRRAWNAGARPDARDPGDGQYHWPSQFKGPNHPNRFVGGVDTITGQKVPTFEDAWRTWMTTGDDEGLKLVTAQRNAYERQAGVGQPFGMVPPDIADPAIADYVAKTQERKGSVLPVTSTPEGVRLDMSAGLPGIIGRAAAVPGEALAGRTVLPAPWMERPVYTSSGTQDIPKEGALLPYWLRKGMSDVGGNVPGISRPVRATQYDEALEPVFDLAGLVMGGGLPAAEKGAVGIAGGRLRADAMEAGRARALERRNEGLPVQPEAARLVKRPDPEVGTPEWDAMASRADRAGDNPPSPLMTERDVADAQHMLAPPAPKLPVSDTGAGYQSLLDSYEKPAAAPVTNRDVTLGSGDTSGTGQARTAALLGLKDQQTGLYSALERAVDALPDQRAPGQQWLNTISNRPGVKPDELQWTGLQQFLTERRGQPVTKADIAEHLASNRVKLEEVNRGEMKFNKDSKYALPQVIRAARQAGDNPGELELVLANDGDAYRALTRKFPELVGNEDWAGLVSREVFGGDTMPKGTTKYHDYQLPGGERYRERLLTIPSRTEMVKTSFAVEPDGHGAFQVRNTFNDAVPYFGKTEAEARALADRLNVGSMNARGENANYRSSHWDEPNVLAHTRVSDRDVGGKRSLHIEEIQSDWHQAGRKQGYQQKYTPHEIVETEGGFMIKTPDGRTVGIASEGQTPYPTRERAQRAIDLVNDVRPDLERKGVPDAPFKKNWHELALKRALVEAAENGYERLSWTPGEAQAARYDLSKQISKVTYNKTENTLQAFDHKGDAVINKKVPPDELPDQIGKEAADKLINSPSNSYKNRYGEWNALEGVDLKVGGEGMAGFYDKMVPAALEKLTKQWGVKAQKERIPGNAADWSGPADSIPPSRIYNADPEIRSKFPTIAGFVDHYNRLNTSERARLINKASKIGDTPVWYIDIPEKMRSDIKHGGFALFAGNENQRGINAGLAANRESRVGGLNEQATASAAARQADAAVLGLPADRESLGRGVGGGDRSLEEASRSAARVAAGAKPIPGLPAKALEIGKGSGNWYIPGPIKAVRDAAERYMASRGQTYTPPDRYYPIDRTHSTNIAKAFDEMKHAPDDPRVKASYDAMIDETIAQFNAMKDSGLKIEFIKPGQPDPYALSPRQAAIDVADNNHLWVFPTDQGFGTLNAIKDNPLLRDTGIVVDGRKLVANDVFRIVHDYFGHLKEGHGFRAAGEDNAWRTHAAMYSDLARPAMTTETRGQNSWVNYGPHGEKNRTASAADTVYADQKIGLLPDWVMETGPRKDVTLGSGPRDRRGDVIGAVSATGKGYQDAVAAPTVLRPDRPLFDYSRLKEVPDVPQVDIERYKPPRGQPERVTRLADRKNVNRVNKFIDEGLKLGGQEWYNVEPLRQSFLGELGTNEGQKAFGLYADLLAATSPRSTVGQNVRNASNYYKMIRSGESFPQPVRVGNNWTLDAPMEQPFGHIAQGLHGLNVKRLMEGKWGDKFENPKPISFSSNIKGNQQPITSDAHNVQMWGLRDTNGNLVDAPGNAYEFLETLQQGEAKKKGLSPAQYQAAGWIGAGGETGLRSTADPLLRVVEQRITNRAEQMGVSKEEVLKQMIRGNVKLLADSSKVSLPVAAANESQKGIRAYHGTPHDFDRFDMSKIGTGEGEQVYGHGLYFAGAEKTGKHYRDILSKGNKPVVKFDGQRLEGVWQDTIDKKWGNLLKAAGDDRQIMMNVLSDLSGSETLTQADHIARSYGSSEYKRVYKDLVRPKLSRADSTKGRMYEVNLDISPEEMLQWERPFAQQPEYVQRVLREHVLDRAKSQYEAAKRLLEKYPTGHRTGRRPGENRIADHHAAADLQKWLDITRQEIDELASKKVGKEIYESAGMPAVERSDGYPKSTARLLDLGVNGLRYLDAGSRPHIYEGPLGDFFVEMNDKKHGPFKTAEKAMTFADQRATHNYVIFDDRLIKILRKYGIVVPGAAGAAASMGSLAPQED